MSERAELIRALAALAERPDPAHRTIAAALGLEEGPEPGDHAAVFTFGAYPYASVYLGPEGMLGGEARDRVAGFWRAIGLVPPSEPDHIASLLGLYASLIEGPGEPGDAAGRPGVAQSRAEAQQRAAAVLLWEHIVPWSTPFLDKVEDLGRPFYAGWAGLLRLALVEEVGGLEATLGPPVALPLHLRSAPGLPDPEDDGQAWLTALLAPVRSGLVLTRWDLRRGAERLGIGARVGERAFMLRSLVAQDPSAVTRWLADEAGRAVELHRTAERTLGPIATFWRRRAEASVAALEQAA